MKKTGPGAFCQSCSKVVVDFTHMTDDQLIRFLNKRKGTNTCGRFSKQQLNRPMEPLPQKSSGGFWQHLKLVLLGALSFKAAQLPAQHNQTTPHINQLIGEVDETKYKELNGQVLDSKSGKGLGGLRIELIQIKTGEKVFEAQSDSLGYFQLQYTDQQPLEHYYVKVYKENELIKNETELTQKIKEGQLLITVFNEVELDIEVIQEEEIMGIMEIIPQEIRPVIKPQSDTLNNKSLYQNLFPQERDQIEMD